MLKRSLLSGAAALGIAAAAAAQTSGSQSQLDTAAAQQPDAQAQSLPEDYEEEDGGEIVVTGARPGGTVIGDIPPENVLSGRDVMATGATDINELLEAIAPQVGSARGRGEGRPVMLVNGQRISSFRELRDIPTEAIRSVEILPEEVALRYGYRADQRVVNIILRPRFRSTVAELGATTSTDGGYTAGEADFTRLMIGAAGRTTLDLELEGNGPLTENERDIVASPGEPAGDGFARSLVGERRQIRATATHNRRIGTVGATGNLELQRSSGRSLIGLGETLLEPLARNVTSDTAHAGVALNGNLSGWRWSVTGNADASRSVTRTDRDAAGTRDRAETDTLSGDVDAMANGSLFRLPGGEAGATVRIGAGTLQLDGDRLREGVASSSSLGRTKGSASANIDLPVSGRNADFSALGNMTLNANAEVEQLSDFGTLTTVGAGLNWSPAQRLNLIASWTREEGAPSIQQLGDPVLETAGTRIFDFTSGQTVLVKAITGGNPSLQADRRDVLKIGFNWKPLEETDLRLRADYVRSRLDRPISSFPGPTPELEAAFPERFVRDASGELVSVDLRPVNFDSAKRDTLRLGFDFSKPLRSARPSQAAFDAMRARRAPPGGQPARQPGGDQQSEGGAPRTPGLGRFGGGGRQGGRLTFSLTDSITLVDEVTIRPGLPKLDYLHGDAVGQFGGRPRHQVEARAGYFSNGLGARLSANWRSGTRVESATGEDLRFSSLATVDLRLWANLGQRFDVVAKYPWLRGSSVRFEASNIFNSRPKVHNSLGEVPFGYQPDLLDPLGRTVSISFRKLFLPPRGSFRRSEGAGGGED